MVARHQNLVDDDALADSASSSSSSSTPLCPKQRYRKRARSWREFLSAQVDTEEVTGPMVAFCFMTGFIDAISFTAVIVWCGFQTGNFANLALASARNYHARKWSVTASDLHALSSLASFNVGAFLGRLGDRIGPQTRGWLVAGTLVQSVLTLVAGVCIQMSGQGGITDFVLDFGAGGHGGGGTRWTHWLAYAGLACMAGSLGLQGIMAKRLNTGFSTTVVLTSVWIDLMVDPKLFFFKKSKGRDQKVLALLALFFGAFLARLLLGEMGAPAVLTVGAAVRLGIAGAWFFVKGKEGEGEEDGYVPVLPDSQVEAGVPNGEVAAVLHDVRPPNYGSVTKSQGASEGRWW
ncbi:Aldedh domain-containing protein [Favolaschia claudopus]|uniref:Aldedh domain-containing protein n=1 Tax=Favolaschia claudopus TaxID=2862362 RepID=A0AAW0E8N2_9AGAR